MPKNLKYAELLDHYGSMLTDRQREILTYYYNEDLSLSEISELSGTSRQGVMDLLRRAETQLDLMESKLHLCDYGQKIAECVVRLSDACNKLSSSELKTELQKICADIAKIPL